MSAMVIGLKHCPECNSEKLIPVSVGGEVNFFCRDCLLCWNLKNGRPVIVDPQTCPGCQLGTTACFERWEMSSSRSGTGDFDDDGLERAATLNSLRRLRREGSTGWGDIESELHSSAREAGVGSLPLWSSEERTL